MSAFIRCNNCMSVSKEKDIIYDGEDDKEYCPKCGESGFLMDIVDSDITEIQECSETDRHIMIKFKPDEILIKAIREYAKKHYAFDESEVNNEELFIFFHSDNKYMIAYSPDNFTDFVIIDALKNFELTAKILTAAFKFDYENREKKFPGHINCCVCGYKQFDEDAIKAHCNKTGEREERGTYRCGACIDNEL